jgi:hypothetical protein
MLSVRPTGTGVILLAENAGKTYGAIAIDVPGDFVNPFSSSLFPCLIWDHDGRFSEDQRTAVAKELLLAGCRYVVCSGQNCEAWHDAVDVEFVRQHLGEPDDVLDAVHIMTSWHAEESPDEVALFFVLNTNFDFHDFVRYLVLHVGDGPMKMQVDAAVRRHALNEEA